MDTTNESASPDPREGRPVVVSANSAAAQLAATLAGLGFSVRVARGISEAAQLAGMNTETAEVLTEVALEDGNWRDLIEEIRGGDARVPVGHWAEAGTAELWWDALECGVYEIVTPRHAREALQRIFASLPFAARTLMNPNSPELDNP